MANGVSVSTEIAIVEAKGALIKDVDGNVFLDFSAAIGVQNAGLFGNVIRFLPPLVMTEEQVKYGMDVLEESIKECI